MFKLILLTVLTTALIANADIKDLSHKYKEVCIKGHVYYEGMQQGYCLLAIKLDSKGQPIPCHKRPVCK